MDCIGLYGTSISTYLFHISTFRERIKGWIRAHVSLERKAYPTKNTAIHITYIRFRIKERRDHTVTADLLSTYKPYIPLIVT